MNEIGTILLTIIGIAELVFTVYIFTRYERSRAIVLFGFFSLCVSAWVITNAVGAFTPTPGVLDFIGRSTFLFASFLFPLLYLFILEFPFPAVQLHPRFIIFSFAPSIVISALALFSKSLIEGFIQEPFGQTIYGYNFWIFTVFEVGFFLLVVFEMAFRAKKLEGHQRWQMLMLLYAIVFSGIVGLLFTLILPSIFDVRFVYWVGPLASVIWLVFMWGVIAKKV